jgi:glycosyltransferase involved in cell wall biosynthesis
MNRKQLRDRILHDLYAQIEKIVTDKGRIEVIPLVTSGNMRLGTARNILLSKSRGEYVCFMDDDDLVPNYYVRKILEEIAKSHPDVIGIRGEVISMVDDARREFYFSKEYHEHFTLPSSGHVGEVYYRNITPLCPIRRELAIAASYDDITMFDDNRYSDRLVPLLITKKETRIQAVMYYYFCRCLLELPKMPAIPQRRLR